MRKVRNMANAKKGCVDDLATLSELNEGIILQELQARYYNDIIYVRKWNDMQVDMHRHGIKICSHSV